MKILLTGATGFLGSHLAKEFLKNKYDVIILKRSFSNISRIEQEMDQLKYYDIDRCKLEQAFQDNEKIDAIVHTATCYGRNHEDIIKIQQTNTQFPLQLLQLATQYNVTAFYNTDTALDKETNEYTLSKKQFLEWGKIFSEQGKIQFSNLKLEHIYGPGDDSSKFVTYVIRECLSNVAELNLTKGEQQRDFIYIDDVVSAYMLLLRQKQKGFQEYQIGSGKKVSVRELVKLVHEKTRSKTKLNFGVIPYREHELMESNSDISIMNELGWEAKIDIFSGIEKILKTEGFL